MEANEFIGKLKASGGDDDWRDLKQVLDTYKCIITKLKDNDKRTFSLNVLSILYRNIEKVPSWRTIIDNNRLLTLIIDCIRATRSLEKKDDKVRLLACVYHLHKYAVSQNLQVPPELILKISYMPFDDTNCLVKEYSKTYWNLLADRLIYIEKLKSNGLPIIKLMEKLTDDVVKTIQIYDTVRFCADLLTFLIRKTYILYSENHGKELSDFYTKVFESLSQKEDAKFKKLKDVEMLQIYQKFNDCFNVVVEIYLKLTKKDAGLEPIVWSMISMVNHNSGMVHCFQTFYLNTFCCIFNDKQNISIMKTILNNVVDNFDKTEKMGFKNIITDLYPYLCTLLRLFIENIGNDEAKAKAIFTEDIQKSCLCLIKTLINKVQNSEQTSKCENCKARTSLHDSLRLSLSTKTFITLSVKHEKSLEETLPLFFEISKEQYEILNSLKLKGCANHVKYATKLQTDIHNIAIMLHKAQHEIAINLFDLYLEKEIQMCAFDIDLKNISRALYNKSICQLDNKLYESALKGAYLSFIFSLPDGLQMDKHMSLVIDIKSKMLKIDEEKHDVQMMSVLDAFDILNEDKQFHTLKSFLKDVKCSALLKLELSMYVKMWPSLAPVAGVWRSMMSLVEGKRFPWVIAESEEQLRWTLYEAVLQTPMVVRSINNEHFERIIRQLVKMIEDDTSKSATMKLVQATLLLLVSEYDLNAASQEHGWKQTVQVTDADLLMCSRTLRDEFEAVKPALKAVQILIELLPNIAQLQPDSLVKCCVRVCEVFVQHLLHMCAYAPGLQLASVCCLLAQLVDDKEALIRNAGVVISAASSKRYSIDKLIDKAMPYYKDLMRDVKCLETCLIFICDVAIYYTKCGLRARAALLTQYVLLQVQKSLAETPNNNLELAVGRLMEAQHGLCDTSAPSPLTNCINVQRHYLTCTNQETKWTSRRLRSLWIKRLITATTISTTTLCRRLLIGKRARSAAVGAMGVGSSLGQASICADIINTAKSDDAQVKIDERLKYILGLQQSTLSPCQVKTQIQEESVSTPRQQLIEPMRKSEMLRRTQISPSIPCNSVPVYKTPNFLKHQRSCMCFACQTPSCFVLTARTSGLEASMYFRANEFEIAKNYFEGTITSFIAIEKKLKECFDDMKSKKFESYIVELAEEICIGDFKLVQVEILIEASFFELSQNNNIEADSHAIRANEIMQEMDKVDPYLMIELINLMTTAAEVRRVRTKPQDSGLEIEFEKLNLKEPPTTPENKVDRPPRISPVKIVVDAEELPIKRKVKKFSLDDSPEEDQKEKDVKSKKKQVFKIPVPVTVCTKPVLDPMTPRPPPKIVLTQPSQDSKIIASDLENIETPNKSVFFTPVSDTPNEQFFTPISTIKTYSKKSLMRGIVKNLENEFSTPTCSKHKETKSTKIPKAQVETGILKPRRARARDTSPGKLEKEEKTKRKKEKSPLKPEKMEKAKIKNEKSPVKNEEEKTKINKENISKLENVKKDSVRNNKEEKEITVVKEARAGKKPITKEIPVPIRSRRLARQSALDEK